MGWTGIAAIAFVCVAANHLGLISAIEKVIGFPLFIVNCPKCCTFWMTLFYLYGGSFISIVAISFLNAWLATWLELGMGIIDTLYIYVYEKIYRDKDDTDTAGTEDGDSADAVSQLQ